MLSLRENIGRSGWTRTIDLTLIRRALSPPELQTVILSRWDWFFFHLGGDDGVRTHDPLLAGQVLSQLSYTPICSRIGLFEERSSKIEQRKVVKPSSISRQLVIAYF